jgi:hypothetical protein
VHGGISNQIAADFLSYKLIEFSNESFDCNENLFCFFAISPSFYFHRNIKVQQADLGVNLNAAAEVAEQCTISVNSFVFSLTARWHRD